MSTAFVVRRGIHRGVLTLLRERQWETALGALFGVFVLVQLLILVLTGLEGMQTMLRNRTDLRLETREQATQQEIQLFYTALQQLPYVADTVYITKEKAYEQTRTNDPELIAFLEEFHIQNPFRDTVGITLTSLNDYDAFAAFVQEERWNTVIEPTFLSEMTDQEEHVYALLTVTRAGRSLTLLILMVTATALVFIITELVRRRALARADEVLVERLVGATPLSIVLPFITEAVLLIVLAILCSTIALIGLVFLLPTIVPALQQGGALFSLRQQVGPLLGSMLPLLIFCELLAAPLIASAGAWLGLRPQITSPRISFAV